MEPTKENAKPSTVRSSLVAGYPRFTKRLADAIVTGIRNGYTRKITANRLGIHEDTIRRWLRAGMEDGAHVLMQQFVMDFERAYEEATTTLVDCVKFHAQDDWRAAAWLLERTRDEFRRSPRQSREVKDALDRLAIEKSEAELRLTDAKTLALSKAIIDPNEVLSVLSAPKLIEAKERDGS